MFDLVPGIFLKYCKTRFFSRALYFANLASLWK